METEINRSWVATQLKTRNKSAHKGSFGTATIVGGCGLYRGAPLLAAGGALRSGTGIVRVASIEAVCAAVAALFPSCILLPLAQTQQATICGEAYNDIIKQKQDALLLGCGLSNTQDTALLTKNILQSAKVPLVVDADALNILAGYETGFLTQKQGLESIQKTATPPILTPHLAEMARICNLSLDEVVENRAAIALEFAHKSRCILVLKSENTLVATPEGELFTLQNANNPGLAKGGSGDVLAGIIVGLLAQRYTPVQAAAMGVWLHSQAGFIGVEMYGETALLPSDLPLCLSKVWKNLTL